MAITCIGIFDDEKYYEIIEIKKNDEYKIQTIEFYKSNRFELLRLIKFLHRIRIIIIILNVG